MKRTGYFATVSGERAATAVGVLHPSRRLFAPEPGPSEPLPDARAERRPSTAEAPVDPETTAPRTHTEDPPVGPPEAAHEPPPPVPDRVERAPALEHAPQPAATRKESRSIQPPHAAVADAAIVERVPDTLVQPPPTRHDPVESFRWARKSTPLHPASQRLLSPTATEPLPSMRRGRVPELRIGTIDVTVVEPTPAPVPARQPRPEPVHRPRPVRGPDRPAAWFGLAQR